MATYSNVTQIDFLFLTNLDYESGDHVGTFDEKPEFKNHLQVYLLALLGSYRMFIVVNNLYCTLCCVQCRCAV
jgi:hypothetical protein